MAMQSSKLAKLKMPVDAAAKKKADLEAMLAEGAPADDEDFSDLGTHAHGGEAPDAEEAPADSAAESAVESKELKDVPDDELMAELKKRGLMSKLGSGEEEPDEDDQHSLMA